MTAISASWVAELLRGVSFEVVFAEDREPVFDLAIQHQPAVGVLDVMMSRTDG
jgi:CheY-like chemotaxis protein